MERSSHVLLHLGVIKKTHCVEESMSRVMERMYSECDQVKLKMECDNGHVIGSARQVMAANDKGCTQDVKYPDCLIKS